MQTVAMSIVRCGRAWRVSGDQFARGHAVKRLSVEHMAAHRVGLEGDHVRVAETTAQVCRIGIGNPAQFGQQQGVMLAGSPEHEPPAVQPVGVT